MRERGEGVRGRREKGSKGRARIGWRERGRGERDMKKKKNRKQGNVILPRTPRQMRRG